MSGNYAGAGSEKGRELLAALLSRHEFVARLSERPRTKPELVADCGVSRSTVDRGIADLEDVGLVRRVRGRYELTLFGEIVAHEFDAVFERVSALAEVGDLVAALPGDAGLDASLFEHATVSRGPGMGITAAMDTLAGATRVRIVNPPLPLLYMGLVQSTAVTDTELTVMLRREMLAELATHIPETLLRFEAGGNELRELAEPLPFSFALVDRAAGQELCLLLGSGEEGLAVVTTTEESAVEWGRSLYESLAATAEPVDAAAAVAD